jgi:hypothetical protein
VGIEPPTLGLKVCLSLFPLCGISELHSRCSVELRLFGLIQGVLRTFSVLELASSPGSFLVFSATVDSGLPSVLG